jgi:hypothetical protein
MIPINELRINNYVYYNNEHNEIGIITKLVTELITDINYVGINNRIDVHYLNKHINPIPLTEELLIKLKFKERKEIINFSEWYIGENPITNDWLFVIKQFKDENKFFFKNGFHIIKYIHELQNLYYALTKEELTLNNK